MSKINQRLKSIYNEAFNKGKSGLSYVGNHYSKNYIRGTRSRSLKQYMKIYNKGLYDGYKVYKRVTTEVSITSYEDF